MSDLSENIKVKILVVDDEPLNVDILENALEDMDVEIFSSFSGSEAVELAKKYDFAVVLLDVQMPGMDGYEVAQELQADVSTRHLPIIFVTANARDRGNMLRGYDVGAVDYITKPFDIKVVQSKVRIFIRLNTLKQKMDAAKSNAEQSNSLKTNFLANVSYEIRTPMHAILSYSKLGIDKGDDLDAAKAQKYFSFINESAQGLLRLVDGLVDLEKIESGQRQIQFNDFDAKKVISRTIDHQQLIAEQKNITFLIEENADNLVVEIDENMIYQVTTNLIANAIKLAKDASIIKVSFRDAVIPGIVPKAALGFTIQHQSAAAPEDDLENVFDEFTQLSSDDKENVGVGLAICKDVIDLHGGSIKVANTGDYLDVTVVLPRVQKVR